MNAARIIIVSVALAVAVMGCSSRTVVRAGSEKRTGPVVVAQDSKEKGGPPPHAPAHGYRHKQAEDGVVLVYDSKIAVYVVTGHNHCYFSNGVYFQFFSGTWKMSKTVSGPWRIVVERDVPSGLKVKYASHQGKTGKAKSKIAK